MGYYRNELYHHGIKGQKWGVRNGPPYPIEDKTLSKGTRLNSVSFNKDSRAYKNQKSWMYTFNPNDKWDSAVYKGPFAYFKMSSGKNYVYEHRYEVVKDLKMPTRKERIDEFINLYSTDKKIVASDLTRVKQVLDRHKIDSGKKVDFNNLKTKEDFENAYIVFNHAMENVAAFKSTKKYSEIMAKKYDAMVDDNNQDVYNEAHDPVIIFRASEALREIGDARMVTVSEIASNYKTVAEGLSKKGKAVML